MTKRTGCTVVSPTEAVPSDEPFDLVVEVRFVNNAFVCQCVTVDIIVDGDDINSFTAPVAPGGDLNPTNVRVTTPLQPPASNPSLPSGGTPSVTTRITADEAGCGTRATECPLESRAGSAQFV